MPRKRTEGSTEDVQPQHLGRRKLVKALGVGGSAFVVSQWSKPIVDLVIVPLHAQATPPPTTSPPTTSPPTTSPPTTSPPTGFSCVGGSSLYFTGAITQFSVLQLGQGGSSCAIFFPGPITLTDAAITWVKTAGANNDSSVFLGTGLYFIDGGSTANVAPGQYTDTVQRTAAAPVNPNVQYEVTYTISVFAANSSLRVTINNIVQL